MQLQDLRTGAKVQFITLRNGKRVGLDKEIYTIKDINFNDWESCDVLVECDGYEVFTTHEAIELASNAAINDHEIKKRYELEMEKLEDLKKPRHYEQMSIFDFIEEVA